MQPSSKLAMAPKRESLPRNWDDYPEPMSQYERHEPTAPQSTMRIPIKVTDDLQRQLGCDGFALESVFIWGRAGAVVYHGMTSELGVSRKIVPRRVSIVHNWLRFFE